MAGAPFSIYLIKPTRYDDDGYPVQWWRSIIPANSLACVTALVKDCIARGVVAEADTRVTVIDEIHTRVRTDRIIRQITAAGGPSVVFMVGVQTNQYPRALDLARPLRAAGVPGMHRRLPCVRLSLDARRDASGDEGGRGAGDQFLRRRGRGRPARRGAAGRQGRHAQTDLQPRQIDAQPRRRADAQARRRHRRQDFQQIRQLRSGPRLPLRMLLLHHHQRPGPQEPLPDRRGLEKIIRENADQGITRFFVTDDNFARNKNWKAFLGTLARLRREEGSVSA